MPLVKGIDSIGLTVSDLDRSVDFYSSVLQFQKVSESEVDGDSYEHLAGVFGLRMRIARMQLGDEFLELTEFLAPRGGRPAPVDSRSNDRWFQHVAIIVSDMDRAYQRLREHKVQHASSGRSFCPRGTPTPAASAPSISAIPTAIRWRSCAFPPDKGNPKWHQSGDRLFLGIDHTAIVISDTEASLSFYRDRLGMEVAGESENYGPEQERLNNVFGARLHITALRAAAGPGIEFLEYLAPRDGRPFPPDEKANDLIHWQTRFVGISADEAAQTLRNSRSPFVSTGAVAAAGRQSGIPESPRGPRPGWPRRPDRRAIRPQFKHEGESK